MLVVLLASTALAENEEYYFLAYQRVKWVTYRWDNHENPRAAEDENVVTFGFDEDEGPQAAMNGFHETVNTMALRMVNTKPVRDPDFDPSASSLGSWKPVEVVPDFENNQVRVRFVSLRIEYAKPTHGYIKGVREHLDEYIARRNQLKKEQPLWNVSKIEQ